MDLDTPRRVGESSGLPDGADECMAGKKDNPRVIPLVAAFLAWLVPGAGHAYVGRFRRGVIIFVTISATFWAGVAIGGVMTVDKENERWWFAAEMLTGAHGLVGWQRQRREYADLEDELRRDEEFLEAVRGLRDPRAYRQVRRAHMDALLAKENKALVAPADTVARAYAGVAGLLNLMCIFDAMMLALIGKTGEPPPPPKPDRREGP
jgi:TM2 domain-containing membrane protein YozV